MSSHLHADRPAWQPPEPGTLDDLISQTQRLRGGLDALRRQAGQPGAEEWAEDSVARWQRALSELAAHYAEDLGGHLDQLREGQPPPQEPLAADAAQPVPPELVDPAAFVPAGPEERRLSRRAGSAEWNLLTDEVSWSPELFEIFGRTAADGPLPLDELPSWVLPEDQPMLAGAVTDCLVDGRPMDLELRILRPDGERRTVQLLGEPVLDPSGGTSAMWAVVRDITELRHSESALAESRESLRRERHLAQTERRVAVELQESVLPPWRGSRLAYGGGREGALDLASHYLPSATSTLIGGDWYDALELPEGGALLSAGGLTGHGVAATTGMATLLGAVRGMALAGVGPGPLLGHLNQLLDSAAQPALGSAVCCLYRPQDRTLTWAQAGHPAPLLFRDGRGRVLPPPEGVLLGATSGAVYGERTERLQDGDLLVLHTDGLAPRSLRPDGSAPQEEEQTAAQRLLGLAPRFAAARTAHECVRAVVEEFGDREREDDACVLVARVGA